MTSWRSSGWVISQHSRSRTEVCEGLSSATSSAGLWLVPWRNKSPRVEAATAPFQYALKTKAGCECVAHVLQTLTDLDPEATVMSIDGVGAYDLISRNAMLEGLLRMEERRSDPPLCEMFLRQSPSTYLWEDEMGVTQTIPTRGGRGARGSVRQHEWLPRKRGWAWESTCSRTWTTFTR